MKKVFNICFNVLFYSVMAVVLAVLVMFLCGVKPFITMSGSMEPNIHTGSMCFVNTRAEYSSTKVGDVIAFEVPTGGLVTHRVISISEEGLETKGDANDVSDGISTSEGNFYGKTLFSVPYVGYAVKYLQQPVVIVVGLILLAGGFALSVVNSRESKRNAAVAVVYSEDEETGSDEDFAEEAGTGSGGDFAETV